MPQTKFVLRKAFARHLRPIVIINKMDRPDARPAEVLDEVFDLFVELGATDEQLDFAYLFASGRQGWASPDPVQRGDSILPVFEAILERVPGPEVEPDGPLQMLVTTLDYSDYVGRIAIGRIVAGQLATGQKVALLKAGDQMAIGTAASVQEFDKLGRLPVAVAGAGDVVAVVGLEQAEIGDTIADVERPAALPRIEVDEPTVTMLFTINDSPLAGQDGQFVTSRHLRQRLERELQSNVALRVEELDERDSFLVSGRGLLHLGILIETMRREGYELAVGKPHVVVKAIAGVAHEPIEFLTVDVPRDLMGPVMELVGGRRGELVKVDSRGATAHLEFVIPARGLMGLRTRVLSSTQGEAIMHHVFDSFQPLKGEVPRRPNGVMVSMVDGRAVAFAIEGLQQRGVLFVTPGTEVYEGMIVGEHARDNDLPVNICREKKLTNMRAASADRTVVLKASRQFSLELALEYLEDDELLEITPSTIRLRKRLLTEEGRRRAHRASKKVGV